MITAMSPARRRSMGDGSANLTDRGSSALGPGEELLIGALRRIAVGQDCAALTRRDFAIAFPGDANEVFVTFRAFLKAVAHAGRRKLRVGLPASPTPTPDETLVIALIAAAQAGDEALFDAYLCWLTRAEARVSVAIMTRALATALAVHGQWLRPVVLCHSGAPCNGEPGTHMWTAPAVQVSAVSMAWSIAVICSAFACGRVDRWPRWVTRIGFRT
jgi:hypothetical protein